uniref:Amine oxidase domain-containing protein n=1 Tax=Oryza nivara TaxID=4536 RepID=A0A0E0J8Q2_ORYNI
MRVAVVGAGVSGLAAAHELATSCAGGVDVTVYEKEDSLGGSFARTVGVDGGAGGEVVHLHLGFMPFNSAAAAPPLGHSSFRRRDLVGGVVRGSREGTRAVQPQSLRSMGPAAPSAGASGERGATLRRGGGSPVAVRRALTAPPSCVTSPNMMQWFADLGANMERSDMSFSVRTQLDACGECEWASGNGISGLLAKRSNALSPSFWRMISETLKFKRDALRYLEDCENNLDLEQSETLGQFVQSHGYCQFFQEAYLFPICGWMWSCPSQRVLGFSASSVLSRTQPLIVNGRSQSYFNKVREDLESRSCRIKTNCHVKSISSFDRGYRVLEVDGSEEMYDRIIVGIHAPDALKLLGAEATHEESRILGAFQYVSSNLYLHCDESFMPCNSSTWSACNITRTRSGSVCVTYWLNLLQNIESTRTFLVTLNPSYVPDHVLLKWNTNHFVPTVAASKASLELDQIQGKRGSGFHEDGFQAGKAAAQSLLGNKIDPLTNPKQMVLSWTETGARLLVLRFLKQYISVGNLILFEEGGTMFSFGEACEKCNKKSVLRVQDPLFYWQVATEADLGLADAYINGCFSFVNKREGLLNLFLILIASRDAHRSSCRNSSRRGWWTPLLFTAGVASAKYFLRHISRKNSVTQTRQNVSQHYDLSNDFFSLFLDKSMTYSSAIFKDEEESLEEAQLRKINLLIHKAKVGQDDEVLEIGSGWGSLAMEVVKQTGCKYTGVTQSVEQLKYAQRRVKEAGLEDRITFLLCDYREIPCHKYDRIICCEMIEEVGHEYMDEFFGCCESLLAENGIFVTQFTSIPEERYDEYRRSSDFIKEYIFPGGCLPSLTRITSAMSAASRLCIEHVENIGYHYYTTLIRWRDNFMANKDKILALGFDEKFIRTWEYYFIYCAAGANRKLYV